MPTVERYLETLTQKGEERKRLTKQLQELCSQVAEEIAASVPVGTEVDVELGGRIRGLRVVEYQSNVGYYCTLAIFRDDEGWAAITDYAPPGDSTYLHSDFGCVIHVAPRDDFLDFANGLPEVVRAFEADQEKAITALRSAFEKLRALAEKS